MAASTHLRILITGGAGFIGSHLCDRFLAEGHRVIAMDNFITGKQENLQQHHRNGRFQLIEHDVSQFIRCEGHLDLVLHFASPASPIDYLRHPIQTLKVGSLGTHNALGLALAKKARFMLASTSEVYGEPEQHPQTEQYAGNVDPIGLRGVYDEAKRFAEALTMAYHRVHGLDTRIVRIFNTYGPRMRLDDGRVVPNFIGQALRAEALTIYGDGSQTRSFQYIDDLIEGIIRLLAVDFVEPVNIGSTQEICITDFAEIVNQLTDNPGGLRYERDRRAPGDPQQRRPDVSRAKELLQWSPTVGLHEGLMETIAHFEQKMNSSSYAGATER
ncbi:MAG: SDR family oxidoreductase [Anaerolineaceae bacterium]|nr:SDR family oxidoreductase [Anaerolineaceae bacterium]MCY4008275.1 SDR family oxidoreductase [Anaerolineaceae bacterium]